MKHRRDIDGLRAVAVIPVVLYHTALGPFTGGFVGVDIFFVISGFLITGIVAGEIEDHRFSLVNFYERRVRRIFPALFFVLFVTTAAAMALLFPNDLIDFGQSLVTTIFFASNVYFTAKSGYFDGPSEFKPLLHTWSLAVEEQFYLLFPLILIAIHRWGGGRYGRWILAMGVTSLVVSIVGIAYAPVMTFYGAPMRAWELMLGAALALGLVPQAKPGLRAEFLALLGAALILYSIFCYNLTTPFPGLAAIPPCLGAALLLYTGPHRTQVARLLSTKPFVAVGLISYSLYLWHWPLNVLYRYAAIGEDGVADHLLIVVLSVALATFSWRYVEQPFRHRSSITGRRQLFAGAGAVAAVLIVLGLVPALTGGFGQRFPAYADLRAKTMRNDAVVSQMALTPCDEPSLLNLGIDRAITSYCSYFGNPQAQHLFVVWGDSHANAWLPVFVRAAHDLNWRGIVISVGGCPPIIGVKRTDPGAVKQHCADRQTNDTIVDFIKEKHPDQIVRVARWGLYANGWIVNDRLSRWTSFLARDEIEATRQTSRAAMAAQLPETVTALSRFARVTLIRSVPVLKRDAQDLLLTPKVRQAEFLPTARLYEDSEGFDNALIHSIAKSGTAREFDPARLLCRERCEFVRDGELLYNDDNHLSALGALGFLNEVKSFIIAP
jgi:peptidoglycan/LPS O-acetylase OafA/YrhL